MYPTIRLRRTRNLPQLQKPLAETILQPQHLIWPIFIVEGKGIVKPIANFPGSSHYSIDAATVAIKNAQQNFGLQIFALFPVINVEDKSEFGQESFNPNNLICRAIKEIKSILPEVLLITDIALDPYTLHGHDGIFRDGQIKNDETVEILCKQALNQAKAGCEILAPSDMMDGRIGAIRKVLDDNNLHDTVLLSYAAKFNTKLYSPFRSAVQIQQQMPLDKSSYQLNLANRDEAMREIEQDIIEGADLIMIKPASICLDVIFEATQTFKIPIFAYQVSGEYFLIKNTQNHPDFPSTQILCEQLLSIKRAGARCILTYGALEIAKFLNEL